MKYGTQVEGLLGQMRSAGISDPAKRFVPAWWRPDTEHHADAVVELKLRLARVLGLKLDALLDRDAVEFELPSRVRFKRAKSQAEASRLNPFVAYAASLAKTIAAATSELPLRPIPRKPESIRKAIFQAHETLKWLSLEALLDFCWDRGIAVIHIGNPPFLTKGFDGLSLIAGGRPVIMLARADRFPAWQVFILAHELAHIALGHVGEDEVILDEAIVEGNGPPSADEPEEVAADSYGLTLLGGETSDVLDPGSFSTAADFADAAVLKGRQTKADPGHLILRSAYTTQDWARSRAALSMLQKHKDHATAGGIFDARTEINRQALQMLNLEELSDSAQSNLIDALGIQSVSV